LINNHLIEEDAFMLMDRIIGAFTFRKGVYADVEKDLSFTTTAWIIVAVVAVLNALGANAGALLDNFLNFLLGALGTAIFALAGFALAAWVVSWIGQGMFGAEVNFGEVVRTLGLAYVWNAVGVLGICGAIFGPLSILTLPLTCLAFLATLAAWFVALREALDLDMGRTIVVAIAGWIAIFMIFVIGTFILASLGIVAGTVAGIFGG
jgi:hypothetical protein